MQENTEVTEPEEVILPAEPQEETNENSPASVKVVEKETIIEPLDEVEVSQMNQIYWGGRREGVLKWIISLKDMTSSDEERRGF